MKQKRKVKSLISYKSKDGNRLTVLLLFLSVVLCLGSASLITVSVGAAENQEDTIVPFTGYDDNLEVIYGLEFLDSNNLGGEPIDKFYMKDGSLYLEPNNVRIDANNTGDSENYVNFLGGSDNEVYSDDVTMIAGFENIILSGNDNVTVLGGDGNKVTGDSLGVPVVIAGGLTNRIEDGKGNVVLGGNENEIVGSSTSIVLGGRKNVISGGENIIIGGENVKVDGIDNIFAFSDSESDFEPEESSAFYLNLTNGVGINADSVKAGAAVSGAIGFGNIDINSVYCTDDNIGVEGARNGCLIGCTEASKNQGKWELLDRGETCEENCESEDKCMYMATTGLQEIPDYTGFCLTDNVDISNATRCTTGEDLAYENVVFESFLIDNESVCPTTGYNKCIYRCNPDFHLTGDMAGGTSTVKCYRDCVDPWDDTIRREHNATVIGYDIENVTCSNNEYKFPYTTSPKIKNGKSPETCGNYNHKKTLICNNGAWYIMDERTNSATGTVQDVEKYKYQRCDIHEYRCDTSIYTLTQQQIIEDKMDAPKNGSRIVADRAVMQGTRGQYKLCIDYNADASNNESCLTGTVDPTPYHYQFIGCQKGYTLYEGVCRKDCSLKMTNGGDQAYHHADVTTGFMATGATCTGTCLSGQIVCNDGTWRMGTLDGEENTQYLYNDCELKDKVCSRDEYNVPDSIKVNSGEHSIYESCDPYVALSKFECKPDDLVHKLVGCETGYHTEDYMYCVPNQKEVDCAQIDGKYSNDNGHYLSGKVTVEWSGEWNTGHWTTPSECEWKCNEGFHLSGFVCVSNIRKVACIQTGKVENSEYITDDIYEIQWSIDNNWPPRPNCDWECIDGYHQEVRSGKNLCVSDSKEGVECRQEGAPEYSYYIVVVGSGMWDSNTKSYTGNTICGWKCNTGYHVEGQLCVSDNKEEGVECKQEGAPEHAHYDVVEGSGVWVAGMNSYTGNTVCDWECDTGYLLRDGVCYESVTTLLPGYTFNQKLKILAGNSSANSSTRDVVIKHIMQWTGDEIPSRASVVSVNGSVFPVYAWFDNGTIYYYTLAEKIYMNKDSYYMFRNMEALEDIDFAEWDTSKVTDMNHMFYKCGNLKNIDVSGWSTSGVVNMSNMFDGCSGLVNLNVSNWNTSSVTNMYRMFSDCKSLTELDLSKWNVTSVTGMKYMFAGCSRLENLDLNEWNISNVTDMSYMFWKCSSLENLNFDKWGEKTSNLKDISRMFLGCSSLKSLNVSGWNTSNVEDMGGTFEGCSGLVELDLSSWTTSGVTSLGSTFDGCSNLKILNVSGWDTSSVKWMSSTFEGCKNLDNLDVSSWKTDNVNTMESMFNGCSRLTKLDVSKWNVSAVQSMFEMFRGCSNLTELEVGNRRPNSLEVASEMFYGCKSLRELDVSERGMDKVDRMAWMFAGCHALTELDVSKWKTDEVIYMDNMFQGCNSLTGLDLSNWNTSKVTTMDNMFQGCNGLTTLNVSNFDTSSVESMGNMFYGCNSLTGLDLSKWNTNSVKNMNHMFYGCSNLERIYASTGFVTSNLTTGSSLAPDEYWHEGMFQGDTQLKGGSETSYDPSFVDKTYARIDQPSLGLPGYFTLKQ